MYYGFHCLAVTASMYSLHVMASVDVTSVNISKGASVKVGTGMSRFGCGSVSIVGV